jgi:hypothetical protein
MVVRGITNGTTIVSYGYAMTDLPTAVKDPDSLTAGPRLVDAGPTAGGERLFRWDGRDGSGFPVPSGAYFVRVATAEGQALSHRLTVIR